MTWIARIKLTNWKCYRGTHELKLEAKSYAIVARREHDAESSNWAGKSSLLEAIDFALYGRLPRGCDKVGDWISRGEKSGEVELELSDGARVVRSRSGTSSTKAWYFAQGQPEGTHQDVADAAIARAVGLGEDEFLNTCYFRQRDIARLVLVDRGERMRIISSMIRLGALEEAASAATSRAMLLRQHAKESAVHASAEERLAKNAWETAFGEGTPLPDDPVQAFESAIAKFGESMTRTQEQLTTAEEQVATLKAAEETRRVVDRYQAIVVEGKELAARLPKDIEGRITGIREDVAEVRKQAHVAAQEMGVVLGKLRDARDVANGRFDGTCPVMGAPCPAKTAVDQSRQSAESLIGELLPQEALLRSKRAQLTTQEGDLSERAQLLERENTRLLRLRSEARALQPVANKHATATEDIPLDAIPRAAQLRGELQAVQIQIRYAQGYRDAWIKATNRANAFREAARTHEVHAHDARRAAAIFGRGGAQRDIAEAAVGAITDGASHLLEECGIPLSVEMRWSRAGSELTNECLKCGSPFAASARIKSCAVCGAERAQAEVFEPAFVLSDRSGAAEDLAGAAVQLAASQWVRADRESAWGVAMLDEPFGAMDARNRRAFASHLASMLRGAYGFRQSFIVAHHTGVSDAFEGRIEVVAGPGGSRVTVL